MRRAPKKHIAYHEAGHAVIAWKLGYEVSSVMIAPDTDKPGVTYWNARGGVASPEHYFMVALAGQIAEGKASNHFTGLEERFEACSILNDYELENMLDDRTEEMVGECWPQIELVAKTLLKKKSLGRDEFLRLVNDTVRA